MLLAKPPKTHRLFALSALTIAAVIVPCLSPGDARAEWWNKRQPVVNGPAATLIRGGPVFINAIDGKEHRRVDSPRFKIPAGRRRIDLCVWARWKKDDGSPHRVPLCRQEVDRTHHRQGPVVIQTGGPFPNRDRLFRKGLRLLPRLVVYDFAPNEVYRITAELLENPWSFRDDGWRVRLQRRYKGRDGRTKWETLYGTVRIPAVTEAFPPHSRRGQPLPSGWRPFPLRPKNPYAVLNADGSPLGADGTLEGIDEALDFNGEPRSPRIRSHTEAEISAKMTAALSPSAPITAPVVPAPTPAPASGKPDAERSARVADMPAIRPPYWLRPPPRHTIRAADRGTPPPPRPRPAAGFGADGMVYADGSPLGADGTLTGLTVALAPETLAETKLIFYDGRVGSGGGDYGNNGRRYADGSALGADGTLEGMAESLVFARLPDEKMPETAAVSDPPSQPAPAPAKPATEPTPVVKAPETAPAPSPADAAIFAAPAETAGQSVKPVQSAQPEQPAEKTAAAVTQPTAEPPPEPAPAPEGGFSRVEKEIKLPAETAEPETPQLGMPTSPKTRAETKIGTRTETETGAEKEIVTTVETAEPDPPITPGIEIPPRPELAEEQARKKTAETVGGPGAPN